MRLIRNKLLPVTTCPEPEPGLLAEVSRAPKPRPIPSKTVSRRTPTEPAPSADASTLEDALEIVRQHGGRVTSSRRIILRTLFSSPGHRTAEELAAEVQAEAPDIHLSTIYRNLEELERLGVVVHSHFGHGPATYHLAGTVHGHFVCEECGTLIEVPQSMFSGLAREAASEFGFTIDPHHFAMLGHCADCVKT